MFSLSVARPSMLWKFISCFLLEILQNQVIAFAQVLDAILLPRWVIFAQSVNDPQMLYAVLSLPNFRLPRSWTLSLRAAARRTTPVASIMVCRRVSDDGLVISSQAYCIAASDKLGHRQIAETQPLRLRQLHQCDALP